MAYFKIIMPNYNNAAWLKKSIPSILNQTFKNFILIIIDDVSTDDSVNIIKDYAAKDDRIILYENTSKKWNGGSRNIGINHQCESEYTLFLDSDDWYNDNTCLQTIYDTIQNNLGPDCLSLSYDCLVGDNRSYQFMNRNSRKELVESLYVACWTKCIKSNLLQLFPENTLMEDVVQHIKQSDVINTVVTVDKAIVTWNRNNANSCSRTENQNLQQGKWQSSMYRYAADLMDFTCKNKECEDHRLWRLQIALNNIKDGKYIQ